MSDYYWCLQHEQVEEGRVCRAAARMGPYETPEAARSWRDRVEQRDEVWDAADEAWHGDDEDDGS